MEDNLITFLGRFHPLIVHLPIGFLFMAGLLQLFSIKNKKFDINPAIAFTLLWGTIASIGSVAIGWLLSLQGDYNPNTLFWHKWLGVFVTILSFFGWLLKTNRFKLNKKVFSWTLIFILVLISVSGHLGGSLTHGDSYLTHYAPNFIKLISGTKSQDKTINFKTIPEDSISVFQDIIQPILNDKCVSCHNSNKKEGGLLLTNYKELIDGSKNGLVINTKKPLESEFLNRVTLPKEHKKFMPPRGTPLTFGEIQIIEWWMKKGADSLIKFSEEKELDKNIIRILQRDFNLDFNEKSFYEKVKVDELSTKSISSLEKNNFEVDFMGENSNMISVIYKGDSISEENIKALETAKEQITWLKVKNCNLNDSHLKSISQLKNLTRLNIHSNKITDEGLKALKVLKNVEIINLYNTYITDEGLKDLTELKTLKNLYVWKTKVTSSKIEALSKTHPQLNIISESK
ncbi:hypothetical protein L3X37_12770 [Sabulilitoribacter arenilitoris]|uniref:Cytochrome C Planctomycete-type domain-containing protein n=1 Tax=Wocania arenilitoris TaxID=2044858 RepID=A0AAE3JMD7_9FLAO|nr:DUF2231 domain-containing protein [Wocania arenilitoris]MCF7569229.1 hypothetical protein [Wocania arenilitoris]